MGFDSSNVISRNARLPQVSPGHQVPRGKIEVLLTLFLINYLPIGKRMLY